MEQDKVRLSDAAMKIFRLTEPFFPPNTWGNRRWKPEGQVEDNGWFDLTKDADLARLMDKQKSDIFQWISIQADLHRKNFGSMKGFDAEPIGMPIKGYAELFLILSDLRTQIFMDRVEGKP